VSGHHLMVCSAERSSGACMLWVSPCGDSMIIMALSLPILRFWPPPDGVHGLMCPAVVADQQLAHMLRGSCVTAAAAAAQLSAVQVCQLYSLSWQRIPVCTVVRFVGCMRSGLTEPALHGVRFGALKDCEQCC
jgi:hypothetical protein